MTASRNRDGLQSQDSSAGMWPNIAVQRLQYRQSPQVLPSGRFIWSALSADRGYGARCSLMNLSIWLIQQNSDALSRSAGYRWARRGVHSGGVGEGGCRWPGANPARADPSGTTARRSNQDHLVPINLRFSRAAEAFNPAFNAASACRSRLRRRVPRPYSVRQRSITTDSGI